MISYVEEPIIETVIETLLEGAALDIRHCNRAHFQGKPEREEYEESAAACLTVAKRLMWALPDENPMRAYGGREEQVEDDS